MIGSDNFDEDQQRLEELSELIRSKLGSPLEDTSFQSIAAVQKRLRDTQAKLASELLNRYITKGRYISELERAVSNCNQDIIDVIGRAQFDLIFGPYTSATDIIDLDLFFSPNLGESSRRN